MNQRSYDESVSVKTFTQLQGRAKKVLELINIRRAARIKEIYICKRKTNELKHIYKHTC